MLLFVTLLTILAATILHAQTSANDQNAEQAGAQAESQNLHGRWQELQAQRLEGSWTIVVTPTVPPGVPQPPSFKVYGSFARGGVFIGSDHNNAFGVGGNPQHGVWEHRGGNRFAYSFKQDLFDATGTFTNVLIVDAKLTLNGRDEFVGVAYGELRDANDNLVMRLGCGTIKGARIKIGSLADQCQSSIEPQ